LTSLIVSLNAEINRLVRAAGSDKSPGLEYPLSACAFSVVVLLVEVDTEIMDAHE